jgi:perosamine synthetase
MHERLDPIPITKPVLGERELELLSQPLQTGWLVQGPMVERFENLFAEFTNAPHALAVSNCTTALHLILHSLGIGPGDEVIVPSFTYVASANAVEYTGASAVFCDIDLATFNIDPKHAADLITPNTKAVMPVSLFGLPAVTDEIAALAEKHNLFVVEDAACALGGYYKGKHAGSTATAAAYSFHPRKALTTGEGGMITTADPQLADLMKKLRNHGADTSDLERHKDAGGAILPVFNMLGFNYRLTDLQGAIGVAQMERAREIISARQDAARVYDEMLAGLDHVQLPQTPPDCQHAFQSYVILITNGHAPTLDNLNVLQTRRDQLMFEMGQSGISVRQGTHAVHTLGYHSRKYNLNPEDLPNALLADRISISLPLFPGITPQQQERVVKFFKAS